MVDTKPVVVSAFAFF